MTPHGLLLIALALAAAGDAKEPTYKVEVHKAADSVVASREKGRTVFVVTSESGIGGADISPAGGDWPENVTLRFRYAEGKGFGALEDVRMWTDRVVVQGTQKESGRMPFCFAGPGGKLEVIEPGARQAAGLLDVRLIHGKEALDVTLPANMLRGSATLRLAWIDRYRR